MISSSQPRNDFGGLSVLPEPPVYILATVDGPGRLTMVSSPGRLGVMPHCFLSPFDTLIESAYLSNGRSLHTLPSSQVNWPLFEDDTRRAFIGDVHLGWPARDGRILLRDGGGLAGFRQGAYKVVADGQEPGAFDVDARALAKVDHIYEQAGLFAWRETALDVIFWDDNKVHRALECALRTMNVKPAEGDPSWDQLALFDPEFEQWHFVPFDKTT
ncbi:hypothetical protein SBC1_15940 [Caballeronia sp. SBC1]|nr:hypothetical protein SBC1_15940 [Caballeronia sp. SBC1]